MVGVTCKGDSQLEKNMSQAFALRRMWEMNDNMQKMAIRMQENAKDMTRELSDMKQGCDEMRLKMEDGVALVCSDVGCACS